jgi:hypothetical protein
VLSVTCLETVPVRLVIHQFQFFIANLSLQTQKTSSSDPPKPPLCQLPLFEILAKHSIPQTDHRSHAKLIPEIDIISGASLAKERPKRHETAKIVHCAQNELRTKIVMGGARSSRERVLVLKAPSVSMAAWESIDIGMTGDSRTEKSAI